MYRPGLQGGQALHGPEGHDSSQCPDFAAAELTQQDAVGAQRKRQLERVERPALRLVREARCTHVEVNDMVVIQPELTTVVQHQYPLTGWDRCSERRQKSRLSASAPPCDHDVRARLDA